MPDILLCSSTSKPKLNWDKVKETWDDATTHRVWRHTVGRISCIARIPIYAVGILAQGGKTVIKGIVSPFVSLGRYITGSEKLESWSFNGVARDGIMIGYLIDRTLNSALCVLCAPPKQYLSMWQMFRSLTITVILSPQHDKDQQTGKPGAPGKLYSSLLQYRAHYNEQILQGKTISLGEIVDSSRPVYPSAG